MLSKRMGRVEPRRAARSRLARCVATMVADAARFHFRRASRTIARIVPGSPVWADPAECNAALGRGHMACASHEFGKHVLRCPECAFEVVDRPIGREAERVRKVAGVERTVSGIRRNGVSACAWCTWRQFAPKLNARLPSRSADLAEAEGFSTAANTAQASRNPLYPATKSSFCASIDTRPAILPGEGSHTGGQPCRRRSDRPEHRGYSIGGIGRLHADRRRCRERCTASPPGRCGSTCRAVGAMPGRS